MNINYGKIKRVIDNLKESNSDIASSIILIEKNKEIQKVLENGLRMSIVQYRETLFDGLSALVKISNNSVNTLKTVSEIINVCNAMGYFRNIDMQFFKDLNENRNAACHRYKQPSFEQLKRFVLKYKVDMENVIADFEQLLGDSNYIKDIDNKLKNSNIIYVNMFDEMNKIYDSIPSSMLEGLGKSRVERICNFVDIYINDTK